MDAETPDVYTEKIIKANKDHICCECQKTIEKGELYSRINGHWSDGGWRTFKTCNSCTNLRDVITDMCEQEEAPPFGSLLEYAREEGNL